MSTTRSSNHQATGRLLEDVGLGFNNEYKNEELSCDEQMKKLANQCGNDINEGVIGQYKTNFLKILQGEYTSESAFDKKLFEWLVLED
jgi:hypothetical protein